VVRGLRPSPRELYRHRHVFEVIEGPHRLLLACTETRLDGTTLHINVEFTFVARGERTLMTMTQRGIPTAELREEHARGVPNALARLKTVILRRRTSSDDRRDPTR
jgi:Activator of Hsp90 ATPase homolog 1-like protein